MLPRCVHRHHQNDRRLPGFAFNARNGPIWGTYMPGSCQTCEWPVPARADIHRTASERHVWGREPKGSYAPHLGRRNRISDFLKADVAAHRSGGHGCARNGHRRPGREKTSPDLGLSQTASPPAIWPNSRPFATDNNHFGQALRCKLLRKAACRDRPLMTLPEKRYLDTLNLLPGLQVGSGTAEDGARFFQFHY